METDLTRLRQIVEAELNVFAIPEHHPEATGSPLPQSWYSDRVAEMKMALVQPCAAKIRDCEVKTGDLVIIDVMIVADDTKGTIVAYDSRAGSFVLAVIEPDPDQIRDVDAVSCGIRGTAVDCFLSA